MKNIRMIILYSSIFLILAILGSIVYLYYEFLPLETATDRTIIEDQNYDKEFNPELDAVLIMTENFIYLNEENFETKNYDVYTNGPYVYIELSVFVDDNVDFIDGYKDVEEYIIKECIHPAYMETNFDDCVYTITVEFSEDLQQQGFERTGLQDCVIGY